MMKKTLGILLVMLTVGLAGCGNEDVPAGFFGERIKSSQTHQSIINLIDDQTDLIISARTMSADEKTYAQNALPHIITRSILSGMPREPVI